MLRINVAFQVLLVLGIFSYGSAQREGFGPGMQDWGWVQVRPGAHMFWWLYFTTADVANYSDRPLALWLQGGPGAASTSYGNFQEIGPIDEYMNPRNTTWVQHMNVVFVDNPVGAGFSYVEDLSLLTTTNAEISSDLIELLIGFYAAHPEFLNSELHIFAESYGGKMAIEFVYDLDQLIRDGILPYDLKSVSLISPWISPIISVWAMGPFVHQMGFIDDDGLGRVDYRAFRAQWAVDEEDWDLATEYWASAQYQILAETRGIDFYNVLIKQYGFMEKDLKLIEQQISKKDYQSLYKPGRKPRNEEVMLDDFMRGPVSEGLGIPSHVVFASQSDAVFYTLWEDFMKPAVDTVARVLELNRYKVNVQAGQLDLVVALPGSIEWVNGMMWSGREEYLNNTRMPLVVDNVIEGYYRRSANFTMFWALRAGHMIPADNPAATSFILRELTNYG